MVAYSSAGSNDPVEVLLKGVIVGIGLWSGAGLLKRRGQVFWFVISLCIYAVCGSLIWLYRALFLPLIYGQHVSLGLYEYLGVFYICGGVLIIWFLLLKQTRSYLNI